MRDTSCLNELYKKFCHDIQQWRFIELYDYAVNKPLGYLIIDFVSHTFKYRLNSQNECLTLLYVFLVFGLRKVNPWALCFMPNTFTFSKIYNGKDRSIGITIERSHNA